MITATIEDHILPFTFSKDTGVDYSSIYFLVLFKNGRLILDKYTIYSASYLDFCINFFNTLTPGFPASTVQLPSLLGAYGRTITEGTNTLPSYATRPADPQNGTFGIGSDAVMCDFRYPLHDHTCDFEGKIDLTDYVNHSHTYVGAPDSPVFHDYEVQVDIATNISTTAQATGTNTPNLYGVTLTFNNNNCPPFINGYAPLVVDVPNATYDPYIGASNADEFAMVSAIIVKCVCFK
jgi:hypothetical protein